MINTYKVKSSNISLSSMNDYIEIWFFGDVHRFTKSCDVDRWKYFLKCSAKDVENRPDRTFFVGMGDYDDFASTREKRDLAHMHETTLEGFDEIDQKRCRTLAMEMKHMRGRTLGLIEGNHHWVRADGKSTTMDLADRLDAEYLGWLCHYTLTFDWGPKTSKAAAVHMVLCHGRAGGKRAGSSINQVEDIKVIFPAADIYCISEDTEILTERGWMSIDEFSLDDTVYCINPDTFSVEKSPVLNRIDYQYDGKMVHLKNKGTDQLLTPNHRVYYRQAQTPYKKLLVKKAGDIVNMNSQIKLPLAGYSHSKTDLTDDEISLAGWIISEGSFKGVCKSDHGSGILIYQKVSERAYMIRDLLDRLGYQYTERTRSDNIMVFYIKKESADIIKSKIISTKTRLPQWAFNCSNEQFAVLLNALVLGDGYWNTKTCCQYYSAKEELIDDLQFAATIHGYRSSKVFRKGGFKDGCFVLSCIKSNVTSLVTQDKVNYIDYSGRVWCIETEWGNFIARRNGKVFITGNCYGHDHQRGAWPVSVLLPSRGRTNEWKIKQKRQFLCRSGSFKRAYEDNTAGYEISRLLKPADLGALKLRIRFHRDIKDGDSIITDIEAMI